MKKKIKIISEKVRTPFKEIKEEQEESLEEELEEENEETDFTEFVSAGRNAPVLQASSNSQETERIETIAESVPSSSPAKEIDYEAKYDERDYNERKYDEREEIIRPAASSLIQGELKNQDTGILRRMREQQIQQMQTQESRAWEQEDRKEEKYEKIEKAKLHEKKRRFID